MDFAALPPEINSGLMYTGPGAGPLLAAATAWDQLAADLHSTASAYGSVVSGLTGGAWQGPASEAMAASAAQHVAWLNTTAAQAEQAAAQANAAAGAYEAAFAATVPPPVIAANRALLLELVATNFFGQNTPAIAATQAQYTEMWAQDAATMYGYAGAASAASTLTPFTPTPATTSPVGAASQSAAVSQATGNSTATDVSTALAQATSMVPNTLASLANSTTASSTGATSSLSSLLGTSMFTNFNPIQAVLGYLGLDQSNASSTALENFLAPYGLSSPSSVYGTTTGYLGEVDSITKMPGHWQSLAQLLTPKAASSAAKAASGAAGAAAGAAGAAAGAGSGAGAIPGLGGLGLGEVSGALGNGGLIGGLSVPQGWAGALPATTAPATTALPLSGVSAAAPQASPAADMLGGVPFMPGGGLGRGIGGGSPRYGFQVSVVPHPPAAG